MAARQVLEQFDRARPAGPARPRRSLDGVRERDYSADFGRVSLIDKETPGGESHYQEIMPPLPEPAGVDGPFKCLEPAYKPLFQNG